MKKELIEQKKKILRRISVTEYRELLAFVEKVYLADYELKILLARKCSNLFFALLELTLEEDGARVRRLYDEKFSGKVKPIIISDRALPYYAKNIQNGEIHRLLIADDVIIHGRTIYQLYKQIEELAKENNIIVDVFSFAENENDVLKETCIQNAIVDKLVSIHAWRAIVDTIIDVLYLSGRPYTSYVPNIVLKSSSVPGQAVKRFLQKEKVCTLHNQTHAQLNLYSYAWIDPKSWKFALFQSMRFYLNEDLGLYIIAPMVSLMPVSGNSLFTYKEILSEFIQKDYKEKMSEFNEELVYRVIVYVISALWSRYFFLEYADCAQIDLVREKSQEEEVNFGGQILDQDKLQQLSISKILDLIKTVEKVYEEVDEGTLMDLSPDFTVLEEIVTALEKNEAGEDTNFLIQHFLCMNGDLDEKEWEKYVQKQTEEPSRLSGYPFSMLTARLAKEGGEAYSHALKAIDFGKGSIVAKKYQNEENVYFISLLHAGEQNYKYKEEKYFPYLYGLFEVERMARERQKNAAACKIQFMDAFKEHFKNAEIAGYEEEELKELCETDITTAFSKVLINDAWSYPQKEYLDQSIKLADRIMNNGDCIN